MAMSMTRRNGAVLAALGLAVMMCASCGGSSPASGGSSGGASTVLTVNNNEGEPLTDTFNPLAPTSTLDVYGSWSMIYEPLIQYDPQRPGLTYPWLATSFAWSNGNKTLTFNLRKNVTWSDGKPFTSADVVYTFNLMKTDSAVNVYGIQFQNISAQGPYQVTMTFATSAYPSFFYIAEQTPMLPQHIWSKISSPATYANTNPVGTGPYVLQKFSPEYFTLTKNMHYWQKGLPVITTLEYVAGTATSLESMVNNGTLFWSSGGNPGAQKWEKQSPYNHYWFPGGGVVSLEPNLTRWPLNNLAVRKAVSLAINRTVIGSRGEFGYETPVTSASGLLPSQQSYVTSAYSQDNLQYDVTAARKTLQSAGFTVGSGGIFQKGGKPVTFAIEDPTGFVDYITDCQLMVQELKQAGIGVTCDGVSTNAWGSDVADGKFQSTIRWSDYGNGNPYFIYNGWLNSVLSAPIGKNASDDFERWNNPASQRALQQYVAATTSAGRSQALSALEGIMVNDVPVIPLVDAADWGTYINKSVIGWPTPQNPYADDSPGASYAEVVALHLRPVG